MSDSEAKAEEHFKEYDMATVRIAAEDEIYYYAARAVRLWSFEKQNKQTKAGVSDLGFKVDAPSIFSMKFNFFLLA